MITRLVKMTFRADAVAGFTELFEARRQTIKSFPGCTLLELWQDSAQPHIFFTYSLWRSSSDLDHYRFSDFFKDTWSKTRALFDGKAEAWSLSVRG